MKCVQLSIIAILLYHVSTISSSSVFNCPAPRSPDNGLSFIFNDGGVVRFRCHPGFTLFGEPESNCFNNQWNFPAPECKPDSGDQEEREDSSSSENTIVSSKESLHSTHRPLFAWSLDTVEGGQDGDSQYGPGARRLPLINGLWKTSSSQSNRALSITPSHLRNQNESSIGQKPKKKMSGSNGLNLVDQELGIAEIRHSQQQEVRKSRPFGELLTDTSVNNQRRMRTENISWRQYQLGQAKKSPTILYHAGSRAASAYKGSTSTTSSGNGRVTIIESQPAPPNGTLGAASDWHMFDHSCNKIQNGQRLFIRAPKVKNAFVHRYERKRNPASPHNTFLTAEYRCRMKYRLQNLNSNVLYCRRMEWIGQMPRCLAGSH